MTMTRKKMTASWCLMGTHTPTPSVIEPVL